MVNVLILCTGNSARSILGEALVTHHGGGRFRGYSAGSRPKGDVHPLAIETLAAHGVAAPDARSKSWDEFAAPGAPAIDVVITVCDSAAAEPCPVWPGHPAAAHWGIPDPAAATGSPGERRQAFERAFDTLSKRIRDMAALPIDALDRRSLAEALQRIADAHPA